MVGSYVFVKARLLLLLMSSHPHFHSLEKKANCLLAGSCMSGKSISSMILLRLYLIYKACSINLLNKQ